MGATDAQHRRGRALLVMNRLLGLALVTLIVPAPLLADDSGSSVEWGVEDARERFRRGVDFYREGSYDAALAEFSKAYEISPDYRVLYNLAQVQNERRDYAAALRLVDDYVKRGRGEIDEARLEQVRNWRPRLKIRVAALWVHCQLDGVELLIDGIPAAKLPQTTPLLVNAGVHHLQLRRHGYESVTRELVVAGSENVHVELPTPTQIGGASATVVSVETLVEPPRQAATIDLNARAAPLPVNQTPLWISLISTVVLVGGAATFGVLAASYDSQLDRELDHLPADRDRVAQLRSQIETGATLCDALGAAAVIAGGISVYLALSGRADKPAVSRGERARVRAPQRELKLPQGF